MNRFFIIPRVVHMPCSRCVDHNDLIGWERRSSERNVDLDNDATAYVYAPQKGRKGAADRHGVA